LVFGRSRFCSGARGGLLDFQGASEPLRYEDNDIMSNA
jgi:hypothetical protein